MLTASCCACSLVGRKSPFLIYSLLSTLNGEKQRNVHVEPNIHLIRIGSIGRVIVLIETLKDS